MGEGSLGRRSRQMGREQEALGIADLEVGLAM